MPTSRQATGVAWNRVVKEFSGNRVLHGVDLEVAPGEFVSLLGPSGCGKTTALRLMAGLEQLTSGHITMNGEDVSGVPTNKRDIGMVFQSYSLFPHLSALANTMFGLLRRGVAKAESHRLAAEALELVGLTGFGERFPHELSGGQQQRVALARALVTSPKVLLLDEPLSALDAKVRVQLREEIRRIQQEVGITTVLVTHDQEEALAVSDRVAMMSAGRIEQVGSPEDLYLRPASDEVARFIGISSTLPASFTEAGATVLGVGLPILGTPPSGDGRVFIRPEHVRPADDQEPGFEAGVISSTFLGGSRRTVLNTTAGELVMQHSPARRLRPGERIRVTIEAVPVVVVG